MKYKIAISGWDVVEVEADSPEDAEFKFFDEGLNALYNTEIEEIAEADKGFKDYTDLN